MESLLMSTSASSPATMWNAATASTSEARITASSSTSTSPKLIRKNTQKTKLPNNFTPGKGSVICGRGKKCLKSPGNCRLRSLVRGHLEAYSKASNRADKSAIVSYIIRTIKEEAKQFHQEGDSSAPLAAFIKREGSIWYEVDDAFAREKIGCMFRDILHTQYRSSNRSKIARKKARDELKQLQEQQQVQYQQAQALVASFGTGMMGAGAASAAGAFAPTPFSEPSHNMTSQSSSSFGGMPYSMDNCNSSHYPQNFFCNNKNEHLGCNDSSSNNLDMAGRGFRSDFFQSCLPRDSLPIPTGRHEDRVSHDSNNAGNLTSNSNSLKFSILDSAFQCVGGPLDEPEPTASSASTCNGGACDAGCRGGNDCDFPDDLSGIFE